MGDDFLKTAATAANEYPVRIRQIMKRFGGLLADQMNRVGAVVSYIGTDIVLFFGFLFDGEDSQFRVDSGCFKRDTARAATDIPQNATLG